MASIKPAISVSRVVLPLPLGPKNNINLPVSARNETLVMAFIAYSVMQIQKKTIIEIKKDILYFHEGVGMYDPSEIELNCINKIERLDEKLLIVVPKDDAEFFVETDKTVLDMLQKDLPGYFTNR